MASSVSGTVPCMPDFCWHSRLIHRRVWCGTPRLASSSPPCDCLALVLHLSLPLSPFLHLPFSRLSPSLSPSPSVSLPFSLSLCLFPSLSLSLRLLPARPSQPVPGMLLPHPCVRRCVGCLHRRRRGYLRRERDGEHGEGGPLQCFFSVFMPPLVPLVRLVEQHSSSFRFSWPPWFH